MNVLVLVALGGCGRVQLDEPLDLTTDAGAPADASPPADARADTGGSPMLGPCKTGTPSCNDNPNVSSGVCDPSGTCICQVGFSINPATGRCRRGSLCEAARADFFDKSIAFAFTAEDCASRPAALCPTPTQPVLDEQVLLFAQDQCKPPQGTVLRLELIGGCASLMSVRFSNLGAPPDLVDCLTNALFFKRWSCAGDNACSLVGGGGRP